MFKVLNFFVMSQERQAPFITLFRAELLLKCTIRVIHYFKEGPMWEMWWGFKSRREWGVLVNSLEKKCKNQVNLSRPVLTKPCKQSWATLFFQSWDHQGLSIIERLRRWFNLCKDKALNGMWDLLEGPKSGPKDLNNLINCMKTFTVSMAECVRNFSLMNNIITDKRAVLLVSNIST